MKHDGGGSGERQAADSMLYLEDLVLMGTPLGCIITLYCHFLHIPDSDRKSLEWNVQIIVALMTKYEMIFVTGYKIAISPHSPDARSAHNKFPSTQEHAPAFSALTQTLPQVVGG